MILLRDSDGGCRFFKEALSLNLLHYDHNGITLKLLFLKAFYNNIEGIPRSRISVEQLMSDISMKELNFSLHRLQRSVHVTSYLET